MVNDFLKSAKDSIAERLASPLLGSFAVAWCLWNYKFLVILFSSAGVSQTFLLIETFAFPDTHSLVTRGTLYPLTSALLYIFAYPYPARFIYEFTLKQQREVNQIKRHINEETLLTLEESRDIRTEFFQNERKNQETVDRLNMELSRLSAALDQAQKEAQKSPELPLAERLYGALETSQLSLLQYLEKKGGKAVLEEFLKSSSDPKLKTEFDLGELQRKKLIRKEYDPNAQEEFMEFTHEGRRVLLNNGKFNS